MTPSGSGTQSTNTGLALRNRPHSLVTSLEQAYRAAVLRPLLRSWHVRAVEIWSNAALFRSGTGSRHRILSGRPQRILNASAKQSGMFVQTSSGSANSSTSSATSKWAPGRPLQGRAGPCLRYAGNGNTPRWRRSPRGRVYDPCCQGSPNRTFPSTVRNPTTPPGDSPR